ncbi:MAG: C40 family peptidase [Hymenobacteraceae bacterium]|nr:C40 family peptidase [Hymenobacteraceae bacterium]
MLGGCARKLNQWSDGQFYSAREIAQKKRDARRLARGLPAAAPTGATATAETRASRRAARRASRYAGPAAPTDAAASLIRTARTYTGTPYRSGGTTRLGMDCSGLLSTTFQEAGFEIPRSSREQSTFGEELRPRELRPGDLIFFATDGGASRRISHVGLVTETPDVATSDVLFIHSSSSLGVKEDNLKIPYWQRAYVKAVRPRLVPRGSADAGRR